MSARIRLEVTPAQLRAINAALALLEAEADYEEIHGVRPGVLDRARRAVWDAFTRNRLTT